MFCSIFMSAKLIGNYNFCCPDFFLSLNLANDQQALLVIIFFSLNQNFFSDFIACSHEEIDVSHPQLFSAAKMNGKLLVSPGIPLNVSAKMMVAFVDMSFPLFASYSLLFA